jgi:hypothetical protein
MAKTDFFLSVRTAVAFLTPRVEVDNPYTDVRKMEQALGRAAIWLTPKSVEGFDPHDFADLPEQERQSLVENVQQFMHVAETVPSNQPATPQQIQAALLPFMNIVEAVREMVRREWIEAAGKLVESARGWAQVRQWPTRCFPRQISEDLIGNYQLEKLVFAPDGSQLVLNPEGRFAPGTDGMFDLAVLPVYEAVMVVRQGNRWYIHSLTGKDQPREWSETAFVETAEELARHA